MELDRGDVIGRDGAKQRVRDGEVVDVYGRDVLELAGNLGQQLKAAAQLADRRQCRTSFLRPFRALEDVLAVVDKLLNPREQRVRVGRLRGFLRCCEYRGNMIRLMANQARFANSKAVRYGPQRRPVDERFVDLLALFAATNFTDHHWASSLPTLRIARLHSSEGTCS